MVTRRRALKQILFTLASSGAILPCYAQNADSVSPTAEKVSNPAVTLWQIPSAKDTINLSYVLKTRDGKIMVVDGGYQHDIPALLKLLQEITGQEKPRIDAWFLTHCHSDHVYGICHLIEDGKLPEIGNLYYSFPPAEFIYKTEPQWKNEAEYILTQLPKVKHTETHINMKIKLGCVTVTVLNDYATNLVKRPDPNNAGIVFRVDTGKTSILFLGDLGEEGCEKLLEKQPPQAVRADIVQVSHHGQTGASEEMYKLIAPKICLWPTPKFVWKQCVLKQKRELVWFEKLGVKTHYISYRDGLVKLEVE